jgi:hypothetical protein
MGAGAMVAGGLSIIACHRAALVAVRGHATAILRIRADQLVRKRGERSKLTEGRIGAHLIAVCSARQSSTRIG